MTVPAPKPGPWRNALPVAKFLWQNRKAEIALVTAFVALGRELVQVATGH